MTVKPKILQKIYACFALICFVSTLAPSPGVFADTGKPAKFPSDLGTVREIFQGSSGKSVILIQDAHANSDAQTSIRKLIDHFQKKSGINFVALEGGSGPLDLALLRAFPDQKSKEFVMDEYVRAGELSGAEMAAVVNITPSQYAGIEDAKLYEENKKAFFEALHEQKKNQAEFSKIRADLDQRSLKIDSPALRKLRTHQVEALADLAKEQKIDIKKFSGLDQIVDALKEKLFQSEAQRALDREFQRFEALERISRLEATREDLRFSAPFLKEFKIDLKHALKFYGLAFKRDQVFADKLLALNQSAIFVGGGFHTDGIKEKLKQAGISYQVVTPTISSVGTNENYLKVMRGEVSYAHPRNLENEIASVGDDDAKIVMRRKLQEWRMRFSGVPAAALPILDRQLGIAALAPNIQTADHPQHQKFLEAASIRLLIHSAQTTKPNVTIANVVEALQKSLKFSKAASLGDMKLGVAERGINMDAEEIAQAAKLLSGLKRAGRYNEVVRQFGERDLRRFWDSTLESELEQALTEIRKNYDWENPDSFKNFRVLAQNIALDLRNHYFGERLDGSVVARCTGGLFDSKTKKLIRNENYHGIDAISSDARRVLVRDLNVTRNVKRVSLWDLAADKKIKIITGDWQGLIFTENKHFFASIGALDTSGHVYFTNRIIKIFSMENGENVAQISRPRKWLQALELSEDGKKLIFEEFSDRDRKKNGNYFLFHSENNRFIKLSEGENLRKHFVFSPRNDVFLMIDDWMSNNGKSKNRTIELRNAENGTLIRNLEDDNFKTIARSGYQFSPDGRFLIGGGLEEIIVWEISSGRIRHRIRHSKNGYTDVVFHPGSGYLITGGYDNKLRIWNLETGKRTATLRAHSGRFTRHIRVRRDGGRIFCVYSINGDFGDDRTSIIDLRLRTKASSLGDDALPSKEKLRAKIERLEDLKEKIEKNTLPELVYFGDKHGAPTDLDEVVAIAKRARSRGTKLHIIGHGDAFDRGFDNAGVWRIFRQLKKISEKNPNIRVTFLLGNHEVSLIRDQLMEHDAKHRLLWRGGMGGDMLVREFKKKYGDAYIEKLKELAIWMLENSRLYEIDEAGILHVHAGIPANKSGLPLLTMAHLDDWQKELEVFQNELRALGSLDEKENWFAARHPYGITNGEALKELFTEAGIIFHARPKHWLYLIEEHQASNFLIELGVNGIIAGHQRFETLAQHGNWIFLIDVGDQTNDFFLTLSPAGLVWHFLGVPIEKIYSRKRLLMLINEEIEALKTSGASSLGTKRDALEWLGEDLWNAFVSLNNGTEPAVFSLAGTPEEIKNNLNPALEKLLDEGRGNQYAVLLLKSRDVQASAWKWLVVADRVSEISEKMALRNLSRGIAGIYSYELVVSLTVYDESRADRPAKIYLEGISVGRGDKPALRGKKLMSSIFANRAKILEREFPGEDIGAHVVHFVPAQQFAKYYNGRITALHDYDEHTGGKMYFNPPMAFGRMGKFLNPADPADLKAFIENIEKAASSGQTAEQIFSGTELVLLGTIKGNSLGDDSLRRWGRRSDADPGDDSAHLRYLAELKRAGRDAEIRAYYLKNNLRSFHSSNLDDYFDRANSVLAAATAINRSNGIQYDRALALPAPPPGRTFFFGNMALSLDGNILVLNSDERPEFYFFDVNTLSRTEHPVPNIVSEITPDGRRAVVLNPNNTISLWDLENRRELAVLADDIGPQYELRRFKPVRLSANGFYAAVRIKKEDKQIIRVFETERGTLFLETELDSKFWDQVPAVLSPDGKSLVTKIQASKENKWSLYDLNTGRLVIYFNSPLNSAVFSPNGQRLAVNSNGRFYLFDPGNRESLYSSDLYLSDISFNLDGTRILAIDGGKEETEGNRSEGVLIETETGNVLKRFPHRKSIGAITSAAVLHPSEKFVLTAGNDRYIRVWDIETGQQANHIALRSIDRAPRFFISPEGSRIFAPGPRGGAIEVYRVLKNSEFPEPKPRRARAKPQSGDAQAASLGKPQDTDPRSIVLRLISEGLTAEDMRHFEAIDRGLNPDRADMNRQIQILEAIQFTPLWMNRDKRRENLKEMLRIFREIEDARTRRRTVDPDAETKQTKRVPSGAAQELTLQHIAVDRSEMIRKIKNERDLPVFLFEKSLGGPIRVKRNPEFYDPTIHEEYIEAYARQLEVLFDERPDWASVLTRKDAAARYFDFFALSDFQHELTANYHRTGKQNGLGREFISEYLARAYAFEAAREGTEMKNAARNDLEHYRKFILEDKLWRDKYPRAVLLAEARSPERVVSADKATWRDWNNPEVMILDDVVYQHPDWREIPGQPGKFYPGEKIIFAQWQGRFFVFYSSRSHTVKGSEIHQWRSTEEFTGGVRFVKNKIRENLDDARGELSALLDHEIYSEGRSTVPPSEFSGKVRKLHPQINRALDKGPSNFRKFRELRLKAKTQAQSLGSLPKANEFLSISPKTWIGEKLWKEFRRVSGGEKFKIVHMAGTFDELSFPGSSKTLKKTLDGIEDDPFVLLVVHNQYEPTVVHHVAVFDRLSEIKKQESLSLILLGEFPNNYFEYGMHFVAYDSTEERPQPLLVFRRASLGKLSIPEKQRGRGLVGETVAQIDREILQKKYPGLKIEGWTDQYAMGRIFLKLFQGRLAISALNAAPLELQPFLNPSNPTDLDHFLKRMFESAKVWNADVTTFDKQFNLEGEIKGGSGHSLGEESKLIADAERHPGNFRKQILVMLELVKSGVIENPYKEDFERIFNRVQEWMNSGQLNEPQQKEFLALMEMRDFVKFRETKISGLIHVLESIIAPFRHRKGPIGDLEKLHLMGDVDKAQDEIDNLALTPLPFLEHVVRDLPLFKKAQGLIAEGKRIIGTTANSLGKNDLGKLREEAAAHDVNFSPARPETVRYLRALERSGRYQEIHSEIYKHVMPHPEFGSQTEEGRKNRQQIAAFLNEANLGIAKKKNFRSLKAYVRDHEIPIVYLDSMAINPNGKNFAVVRMFHRVWMVELRDAASGNLLKKVEGSSPYAPVLSFSFDGNHLLIRTRYEAIVIDVRKNWSEPFEYQEGGEPGAAFFLAAGLSSDGRLLATSDGEQLRVRDIKNGAATVWSKPMSGFVVFSADGHFIFAKNKAEKHFEMLNFETGQLLHRYELEINAPIISPSGNRFAVQKKHGSGNIYIYDTRSGQELAKTKIPDPNFLGLLAFSPDDAGIYLENNGSIHYWVFEENRIREKILYGLGLRLHREEGVERILHSFDMGPDGHRIVGYLPNGNLALGHVENAKPAAKGSSLGTRQTAIRLLAGKTVPNMPKEVQKLVDEAGVIPDEKVEKAEKAGRAPSAGAKLPVTEMNNVILVLHVDSLPDEITPGMTQILSQAKKLILVFPQGDEKGERIYQSLGPKKAVRFSYVGDIPVRDIQRMLEKERGAARGFLTQNLNLVSDRLKSTREKISYFELDGRQYRETLAENALALILRLTQNPESIHEWQGVAKAASLGNGLVGISFDLGALVERLTVINDTGKSLARAA